MPSSKPTIKDCRGCEDNFYNQNDREFNMTPEGPRCWSLESAEFVMAKDIPTDQPPPYLNFPVTKRLNCYHRKGIVRVDPSRLDEKGYWK